MIQQFFKKNEDVYVNVNDIYLNFGLIIFCDILGSVIIVYCILLIILRKSIIWAFF